MGCPSSQGHDPCCICFARIAESTTVVVSDLGCDRCRGPFQFFSNAGSEPHICDGLEIRREAADASYWRGIRLRRKSAFDARKAQQQLREALQESPPPSFLAFQRRTRYHYGTGDAEDIQRLNRIWFNF